MWQHILTAISLYLIIEGMIPFISPNFFRKAAMRIAQMDDNSLRVGGLTIASAGLIMLYIVR